jgi:hypothetical protein
MLKSKKKLKRSLTFRLRHRFLLWRLKEHAARKAAEAHVLKPIAPIHVHEAVF